MPPKPNKRKGPEYQNISEESLATSLVKLCGLSLKPDTLETAINAIGEYSDTPSAIMRALADAQPYPNKVPVAQMVMAKSLEKAPLVSEIILTEARFVVSDLTNVQNAGLFLVGDADLILGDLNGIPYRAVVNHFIQDDEVYRIAAVQLKSCWR